MDPLRLIHPTCMACLVCFLGAHPAAMAIRHSPTAGAKTVGWNKRSGSTRCDHREDFDNRRFRALRTACWMK